jgi:hypothetical protein
MATSGLPNPKLSGSGGSPTTDRPAALRVVPADGSGGIPNVPYELYFFVPDEWKAPIPPGQEDARRQMERFSSILRLALEHKQAALNVYYGKLLTMAQGAFNSSCFRPESLSDLEIISDEVVRLVGPQLRHKYLRSLERAVLIAFCLVLDIAAGLDWLVKQGVSRGHVVATVGGGILGAAADKDEEQGQPPKADTKTKQFRLAIASVGMEISPSCTLRCCRTRSTGRALALPWH